MKPKTTVLIVDDSTVMRNLLKKIFSMSDDFEVIGVAPAPYVAREKIAVRVPDIMTLDIEMPKMDGLTFLKKVMEHFPIRTLILSSLSIQNSNTPLEALASGAVDVMAKPAIDLTKGLEGMAEVILSRCRAVASLALAQSTHQVVAIASSTGGTEALRAYFRGMPAGISRVRWWCNRNRSYTAYDRPPIICCGPPPNMRVPTPSAWCSRAWAKTPRRVCWK